MGHTPGPWEVVEPGEVDEHYAVLDVFGHTASVYGYPEEAAVALANARLMAAAPEMLAALKQLVAYDEGSSDPDSYGYGVLQKCKAAINKAEGRGE